MGGRPHTESVTRRQYEKEGVLKTRTPFVAVVIGCWLILGLTSNPAQAQFAGANFRGDFGLQSGSQPDPGWYATALYVRYDGDTVRDSDGNSIGIDPERRGDLAANGYSIGIWGVTKIKIFGANYSFMVFPGWTDNTFEVPILAFQGAVGTGLADTYLQPINLGWHTKRADFIAGLGLFAPTGSYDPDASDNLGLGMWSFELFGGTTVFLDKKKSWSFATTAFYETHTKKKDTDIKVGDLLTLEGGVGKSFKGGMFNVGAAYFAQWKLSHDDIGQELEQLLGGQDLPKNRVFGLGPEVTVPIATKRRLIALLTARYLWEFGARTTLEGSSFVFQATFPIPSVRLQ